MQNRILEGSPNPLGAGAAPKTIDPFAVPGFQVPAVSVRTNEHYSAPKHLSADMLLAMNSSGPGASWWSVVIGVRKAGTTTSRRAPRWDPGTAAHRVEKWLVGGPASSGSAVGRRYR
jgi:hypothetical protein